MDLTPIPLFDHHAHPLHRPEATADAAGFRRWFTESTDPEIHARHVPHTLLFQTAVRWLAELLACEPTPEAVLAARAAQPWEAWVARLFREANIGHVLCDYGYAGDLAYEHDEMQALLLPCRVTPIMRLESMAEMFIETQDSFDAMLEGFDVAVGLARTVGYAAFKSIAAYRSGLAIGRPSRDEAAAAFAAVKEEFYRTGCVRLASKPLVDYLLWQAEPRAAKQELPIQFHTGFGDRDADLRQANPLHLRAFVEEARAPIVLLHAGWPFYREAAHLASLYGHVWLDVSLAVPFATAGIPAMLRDILGMAPFSKVLFATDAFTMPEIYWLAARWGRWGLGQVLDDFIAEGFLDEPAAWQAAEALLGENARGLYGLS